MIALSACGLPRDFDGDEKTDLIAVHRARDVDNNGVGIQSIRSVETSFNHNFPRKICLGLRLCFAILALLMFASVVGGRSCPYRSQHDVPMPALTARVSNWGFLCGGIFGFFSC